MRNQKDDTSHRHDVRGEGCVREKREISKGSGLGEEHVSKT